MRSKEERQNYEPHMLLRVNVNVPAGTRVWTPWDKPHSTNGSASLMSYPLVQVTTICSCSNNLIEKDKYIANYSWSYCSTDYFPLFQGYGMICFMLNHSNCRIAIWEDQNYTTSRKVLQLDFNWLMRKGALFANRWFFTFF